LAQYFDLLKKIKYALELYILPPINLYGYWCASYL